MSGSGAAPGHGQREAGILAIWSDCDRTREAEYERWYRTEHLPERVSVPGFRFARRYEAIGGGSPRFFTYYEVDTPQVLVSAAYLERSNTPTALTRKIMAERILRNLSRTACRQTLVMGGLRGAFVLTARWTDGRAFADATASARQLGADMIEAGLAVRAETWQAVAEGTGTPSVEQSLREGPDQSIVGALLIETTRDRELAEIFGFATARVDGAIVAGYRLLCSLTRHGSSA